jgi:hypothetical protein
MLVQKEENENNKVFPIFYEYAKTRLTRGLEKQLMFSSSSLSSAQAAGN